MEERIAIKLRKINVEHGIKAVHETIERLYREDYEFLRGLYEGPVKKELEEELEEREEELSESEGEEEESEEEGESEGEEKELETAKEELEEEKKKGKRFAFYQKKEGKEKSKQQIKREELREYVINIRKEMKEKGIEKREIITKENLEKLVREGKSYVEIGKEIGLMPNTVKKHCDRLRVEKTKQAKFFEEKKICPDDYKEIIQTKELKEIKIKECKILAKNKTIADEINWKEIEEEKRNVSCVYGIFQKNTMNCIYVGSTDDIKQRYEGHKRAYETYKTAHLYSIMHTNGGWENYIFINLEKRENHIGLNIIESIWWRALEPAGNKKDPLLTR